MQERRTKEKHLQQLMLLVLVVIPREDPSLEDMELVDCHWHTRAPA